jgi:hypothetical protein
MIGQDTKVQMLFAEQAGRLNDGAPNSSVDESLNLLAKIKWLGHGVSEPLGGSGGVLNDAIEAIASVSEECLTSGFVFWCQRVFIEYLVASNNIWLHRQLLPKMLQADFCGATGLSNAMKHLSDIEPLQVEALLHQGIVTLNGSLPWVSNLKSSVFVAAVAAQTISGDSFVVAVPATISGVKRGEDLQLMGLQASWTSTLHLEQAQITSHWIISDNARAFLAKVRPAFLLLQCGLGLGVTRRALQETRESLRGVGLALGDRLEQHQQTLSKLENTIRDLSFLPTFDPTQLRLLFETRIAITRLALETVWLELEAKGGVAYLKPSGTARRLREAAFLPLLTPTLVQLETELRRLTPADCTR